jgi:hypothetical protein
MDFANYTFYISPPKKTQITFKIIINIVAACLLLMFYYFSLNCADTKWPVRLDIPKKSICIDDFHTGDMLLVFEQGHDFLFFPGHMAIVLEIPKYQQKYVWDLPNPIKHSPNVLKPLGAYLTHSLKPKNSKLYVHHLQYDAQRSPVLTKAILQSIKEMSASIHYKLQTGQDHINFCAQSILGFPGIPNLLPNPGEEDLHYCSSAIFDALIKCRVLKRQILHEIPIYLREKASWSGSEGSTVYPQMFVSADWDLGKYVQDTWVYTPLIQLINPVALI